MQNNKKYLHFPPVINDSKHSFYFSVRRCGKSVNLLTVSTVHCPKSPMNHVIKITD